MSTTQLALRILVVASLIPGCATSPGGDDDGSGDDDGPIAFTNGTSTLAGMAEVGYVDGARRVAKFSNPVNVIYRDGTLYVADSGNHRIRKISRGGSYTPLYRPR